MHVNVQVRHMEGLHKLWSVVFIRPFVLTEVVGLEPGERVSVGGIPVPRKAGKAVLMALP